MNWQANNEKNAKIFIRCLRYVAFSKKHSRLLFSQVGVCWAPTNVSPCQKKTTTVQSRSQNTVLLIQESTRSIRKLSELFCKYSNGAVQLPLLKYSRWIVSNICSTSVKAECAVEKKKATYLAIPLKKNSSLNALSIIGLCLLSSPTFSIYWWPVCACVQENEMNTDTQIPLQGVYINSFVSRKWWERQKKKKMGTFTLLNTPHV